MMRQLLLSAVLLSLVAASSCRRAENRSVTIATTPDVAATGIQKLLVEEFAARRKVPTAVLVTEAELIPQLVASGVADVVITRSRGLYDRLAHDHHVLLADTFATETLLIAGPGEDPARIRNAPSPGEAFRRIARRDRAYCSPVDIPELRAREASFWTASKVKATDDRRYRLCHGDATAVLHASAKRGAYTLTWSSAFDDLQPASPLAAFLRDEASLREEYRVVLVADPARKKNALWFFQWVMSSRARDLIAAHRFEAGRRLLVRGQ